MTVTFEIVDDNGIFFRPNQTETRKSLLSYVVLPESFEGTSKALYSLMLL